MTTIVLKLIGFALLLNASPSLAAATINSPDQDRSAKTAVPPAGKAMLYVYRLDDASPQSAPGLWINGQATGPLPPRSFRMWGAMPGRLEIHTGRLEEQSIDTMLLGIQTVAGQAYYVRLTVDGRGGMALREMHVNTARAEMRNARLVQGTGPMADAQPPAPASVSAAAPAPQDEKRAPASDQYGVTLTLKAGTFLSLSKNQTVDSASRRISMTSFIYGLQGEWRHQRGLAVGLEWLTHTNDYATNTTPASGDAEFSYLFLNVKQYFNTGTIAQPYIGAGVGRTKADFSSNSASGVNDSVNSNALQFMAGVAFRWSRVDAYTEYKYLHDEFSLGGDVKASGNGLFVGVSTHF